MNNCSKGSYRKHGRGVDFSCTFSDILGSDRLRARQEKPEDEEMALVVFVSSIQLETKERLSWPTAGQIHMYRTFRLEWRQRLEERAERLLQVEGPRSPENGIVICQILPCRT